MNSAEQATGSMWEDSSHKDKTEKICGVMAECCAGMSTADKKTMMRDMMPRMVETMSDDSVGSTMGMMMNHCMRVFRWFPLIPIGVGIVLFLLGYFLSAEVARILWLVLATIPVLLGLFGFIMMSALSQR